MTYEKKIYDLHIKFITEYEKYSKEAVSIAQKMAGGLSVSVDDHKRREALYNSFMDAFSQHKKLQQYILENKVDIKKEVEK